MNLPPTSIPTAPGALPIIGHGHKLARDSLPFMRSLRDYGPVVRIRIGPTPAYVLTDPELARRMLVTDAAHFLKGGRVFDALRAFFGNGIATIADGDAHLHNRRRLQPMFNRAHIAARTDPMVEQVRALVSSWGEGQERDVYADMNEVTLAAFLTALFGTNLPDRLAAEFTQLMPVIMRGTIRQTILPPWVTRLPLPANRAHEANLRRLRAIIDQATDHARGSHHAAPDAAVSAARDCPHHTQQGEGLLQALLTTEDLLSQQQLQDEVITLLVGAIETTGTTLAWALYELTQHDEITARLRTELDAVCGERPVRHEDLDRLPYIRQVLQEAIRKYGPVWLTTRTATRTVGLGGHRIPAGSDVVWSPYLYQHDPQVFADPECFDPDRWAPERAKEARNSFLAFGAGRRQCIGEAFAWAELTIILATILQIWSAFQLTSRTPQPQAVMTVTPDVLTMAYHRRAGLVAEAGSDGHNRRIGR
ncbi:cytochrome P450 [Streptomyces sp. HC44]|uniref:Cytochrome P450 n=1 Tax=Streptomyces scabichelini TaxID=2711217 RepID=A0A6G4VAI2_9ACTN|nr:cytochrome P450 [Streptomyces scabichelini]NGO10981.1 cytochrome P450 [Streptomyces scabichelini]